MYKLVSVFNNRRVEIFFTVTIFIALLPIDKIIRSILIVALFIYFHKDYKPILLGILILFFVLMNNFALFVVDKEIFNNGEQRYYSVSGTVEGRYLNVGDIIIGDSINISDTKFPKYKIKNEYFRIRLPFYTSLMKIRDYNTEKLYNVSNSNISLLQAIFYGNKRYLNDSVIELFTVTGLNHLLAISGQHVGIILMIIFLILYKIPTKIKFFVATIFIFLFIPIAGFKIPVLRASVFLFIVSFAYLWDRKVVLSKLVIWVASVFIAIDPEIIYSDSFVLSFLAVLGISMIDFDRYQNKIYLPLLIGLYASAFTLPYVSYHFGMFNILSIFNTILITPLISVIIMVGIISLFSVNLIVPFEIFFEKIVVSALKLLHQITDFGFFLISIEQYLMLISIFFLVLGYLIRYRSMVFLTIPLLFIPSKTENLLYFPAFDRSQGYIIKKNKVTEVYFKGSPSEFRYKFLPLISKYIKKRGVDYGEVILPYDSKIVKIHNEGFFSGTVCFNENGCDYVILNDGRKVKKVAILDNKTYINYLKYDIENTIKPNQSKGYMIMFDR